MGEKRTSRSRGRGRREYLPHRLRSAGERALEAGQPLTGDEEARDVVEQLNRDAGYEPLHGGPLENARTQEEFLAIWVGVSKEIGPFFYWMAPPAEL
jgi:predicted dinucleotide-binding enzyme